jgi:hypothetical protein
MFNTMTVFQLARNPQLLIKPLGTENNIKEMKRERKIPPAQDGGGI